MEKNDLRKKVDSNKSVRNRMFVALSRNPNQIANERANLVSKRTIEHANDLLEKRRRAVEDIQAEIEAKYDISALPNTEIDNRVKGDNKFASKFVEELDKLYVDLAEAEMLYGITAEWVEEFTKEIPEKNKK